MELKTLTVAQLKHLMARVTREIENRQTASKTSMLKRFAAMAREEGFSLSELLPGGTTSIATKPTVTKAASTLKARPPIRYRHPSNSTLAWSGRGRKPGWVDTWLNNGGTMGALQTAAEKFGKKVARTANTSTEAAPKPAAGA